MATTTVYRPVSEPTTDLPDTFTWEEETALWGADCFRDGRTYLPGSILSREVQVDGFEAVLEVNDLPELDDETGPAPWVQVIEVERGQWDEFFGVNDRRVRVWPGGVVSVRCVARNEVVREVASW